MEMTSRVGRGWRWFAVGAAIVVVVPSILAGADRASALSGSTAEGATARSLEEERARARALLGARRYAEAADAATHVLGRAPLDQVALRTLYLAELGQGHDERAGEVAIGASFVSWRDPVIQLRMIELAAVGDDAADVARRADALARIPNFERDGYVALTDLLGTKDGMAAVTKRLAADPPWRSAYLKWLSAQPAAVSQSVLPLFDALGPDVSRAERAAVFQRLIAHGGGERAYAYWRAHVGRGEWAIVDPDFAQVQDPAGDAATIPFAWTLSPATPVRSTSDREPGGRPALTVEPTEERSAMFVSLQFGAAPGRHVLGYAAAGAPEQLDRLHPEVICPGVGRLRLDPVATTPVGGETRYRLALDVPRGCGLPRLGFTFDAGSATTPVSVRSVTFDAD